MDARHYFAGKKITVLGLGLLGRGVGDTRYLAEQGADLIVTDLKTKEELASSLALLEDFPNITYRLGEHRVEDFQGRDFILKAAGVPDPSPYLDVARSESTPIKMSASWFAEIAQCATVGITGTRGKSTTTYMVYEILKAAGKKVLLGGNVRGVSTLALLDEVTKEHVAVLELDSWQCQGWGESHMSPQITVFTTFYPDHLNYYKNNLDAYLADKAKIVVSQTQGDTLVLGSQCAELLMEKYRKEIHAKVVVAGSETVPASWTLRIPGMHNRYNAGLALEVARALSIDENSIQEALEHFEGVEGRLQFVREIRGVRIYNDTNATTPDATLVALRALTDGKRTIVLVMGGADKGLDMNALLYEIPAFTKRVILLPGSGTNKVLEFLPGASVFDSLEGAIREAFAASEEGDVLLFSPAFASFGMFKNEYDRGDQFNEIVQALC